jgi:membrane protein DedA with SNARE-associated domain
VEYILEFIQSNIHLAPWLIFGVLLLAGLNLPVSEDGMLFIAAILAKQNPDYMIPLFLGVYLGAFCSDLICFSLGWFVGPKVLKIKFFSSMLPPSRRHKIHSFYERYGVITLIIGRFIPFGVRNGLFLTAGLGKMHPIKFSLSDLLACTISSVFYFALYYHYGAAVIEYVKKGNIFIFSFATILLLIVIIVKKSKKR